MASEQDMIGALRQAHDAGDTAGAQRIADMITTQRQATAAPADQGALMAGINAAADTATLGLIKPLSARLAAGISHLTANPISVDEASSRINASHAATANAHPWATVAGDVAGVAMGAGGMSAGAKAAEAAPGVVGATARAVGNTLTLQKGQVARNVVRLAAPGAVMGGVQAEANGEGVTPQAGLDTALGAAGGVAGGAIVAGAGKLLQSPAIKLLASRLSETPDVLANAMANFRNITGRHASMSDVVNMKSTGQLKHLAEHNPAFGAEVAQETQRRATAPPQGLTNPAGAPPTVPTDINSLATQRKANMDTAMAPISSRPVTVDQSHVDMLYDPRVRRSFARGSPMRQKLVDVVNDLSTNQTNSDLTIKDFDQMRQAIRGQQSSFSNPANSKHNPHTAQEYGDLADTIASVATGAEPQYAAALKQFTEDSNYIHGFKHGRSGKVQGDAEISSPAGRALNTAEGQIGYDHGAAEAQAAQTLDTIAPAYIKPPSGPGASSAAHLAVGVAKGGPWGAYHILKAIPGVKASDGTLRKAAQMLTDPKQAPQAIAALRRLGVQNKDISRVASAASAAAGSETSQISEGQ